MKNLTQRDTIMVRLDHAQLNEKINFIDKYVQSSNAAEGSVFDANANVDSKNIATMEAEIHKDINIQINRELLRRELERLYGEDFSYSYIDQLKKHEIYTHDETSLKPYCVSVTMYPFLLNGVTELGGESKAPKHLASFCGSFINFVYATASQFAGAVATVEWLLYFDYFARKDFGDNYLETHTKEVQESMQHVVYSLNQPAAARGYQSVFWNISVYDRPYYEAMFGNFTFPDFSKPTYESLDKLQRFFMKWFNSERNVSILTYPVVTAACLTDGKTMVDKDFEDHITEEMAEGNSFFIFMSENAHALASCCFEGEETIKVLNTITNQEEIISMRLFVEMFNKERHEINIDTKYKIMSLNPKTLEEEMVDITGTLRKENNYKQLIEINCNNQTMKVTPDHLFLVKNIEMDKIEEITASVLVGNEDKYLLPV